MAKPLPSLREIRSFHIGGAVATTRSLPLEERRFGRNGQARPIDPNGEHITGQMYVQAFLLEKPRYDIPVLLWHGGGMTGMNWETTPDSRPGWLNTFLYAGFDVYISDAVERGRASWSRWPEIYRDAPVFRTLNDGWDMFRFGPPGSYNADGGKRMAYAGGQFPVEAFEQFAAQWVPRWTCNDEPTLAAYDALLQHVGKCVVIGHSQGGGFALEAVRRRPECIAAVVAIEPSGAPLPEQIGALDLPAHLSIWGDNLGEWPVYQRYRKTVDAYFKALADRSVLAAISDLPSEGMFGNSHFPMLDRNSDLVATYVIDWLANVSAIHFPVSESQHVA